MPSIYNRLHEACTVRMCWSCTLIIFCCQQRRLYALRREGKKVMKGGEGEPCVIGISSHNRGRASKEKMFLLGVRRRGGRQSSLLSRVCTHTHIHTHATMNTKTEKQDMFYGEDRYIYNEPLCLWRGWCHFILSILQTGKTSELHRHTE